MSGFYPDKPVGASDGESFARLCIYLMDRFLGEKIHMFTDRKSQFEIGESVEGVEFKELSKSRYRLHIEIAERTSIDKPWVPSGVMRVDNTIRYMCGNDVDIFLFKKGELRAWHKKNNPKEVWFGKGGLGEVGDPSLNATIHSFVLHKEDARRFCLCRFQNDVGDWRTTDKLLLLDEPLEQIRNDLRNNKGDAHRRRSLWLTLDWLVAKESR